MGANPTVRTIMAEHFIKKCSCGEIIEQCRCMSPNKTVTVVKDGCDKCKAKGAKQPVTRLTALELEK